jgi:hypothetical protein
MVSLTGKLVFSKIQVGFGDILDLLTPCAAMG